MSKRLQVLLEERELKEIQRIARGQRTTVAEWVRQALRNARQREPLGDTGRKLEVVRAAALHSLGHNTPLEGRRLDARVLATVADGRFAYLDDSWAGATDR